MNNFGLNLTGGGARGAYQAGALIALFELLEKNGMAAKDRLIFNNLSGVSAGAINTAFLGACAHELHSGMNNLRDTWNDLTPSDVYKTDLVSLGGNIAKWISDLSLGSLTDSKSAKFLLNTAPLRGFLESKIDFSYIQKNFKAGYFSGIACSAYNYYDQRLITFLKTKSPVSWNKPKRYSLDQEIQIEHVLASCAIPLIFPSVKVNEHYMGDGTFRSNTPISPLIHMGSNKILVIGVRGPNEYDATRVESEPGISRIAGLILNALFFDTLDIDIERIENLNEIVDAQKGVVETHRSDYNRIDIKLIRPSEDVSRIAAECKREAMPKAVQYLLAGLGEKGETKELASYILFHTQFTSQLIELGYQDVYTRKDELLNWFSE